MHLLESKLSNFPVCSHLSRKRKPSRPSKWPASYNWQLVPNLISPSHSQDLISNSLHNLPYSFYDVSSENLVLDQLLIPNLTDSFLYSHHLHTWYCTDILRRNSVLVTHGNKRVKPCLSWHTYLEILREVFSPHSTVTGHFSLRCSTVRSVTVKGEIQKVIKKNSLAHIVRVWGEPRTNLISFFKIWYQVILWHYIRIILSR